MIRVLALLIGIVCLVGCHAPPVQEMSDARQAIAAAQVAGAPERAPNDFAAAQAAIGRAEAHLQAQEYTRARLAALEAKHRAAAALATAERTAPPGEGPQSH
jgi:hypothetical protein